MRGRSDPLQRGKKRLRTKEGGEKLDLPRQIVRVAPAGRRDPHLSGRTKIEK